MQGSQHLSIVASTRFLDRGEPAFYEAAVGPKVARGRCLRKVSAEPTEDVALGTRYPDSCLRRLVGLAGGRLRPNGRVENSMEQDRDNLDKALKHYNGVLLKAGLSLIVANPEEIWQAAVREVEKWFDEVPNFGDCVLKVADVLSRKDGSAAVAEARQVVEEFLVGLKPPGIVPTAA